MTSIREQHPPVPLEGRVPDPTALARLACWLSRGEWSGAVSVVDGGVERRLFLVEGRVNTATSTHPEDSLAGRLVTAGLVSQADVEQAGTQVASSDRGHAFARQLVRLHLLAEQDLSRAERQRVIAIAQAALAASGGEYRCLQGAVAADPVPAQALEVPRIVATAVLTHWDEGTALEVLGGAEAILDLDAERLNEYEATSAEEAYDLTLLRVNGRRNVAEVVQASPLPPGAAVKFLAACRLLSCIRVVATPETSVRTAPAGAPRAAPRSEPAPAPRSADAGPAAQTASAATATEPVGRAAQGEVVRERPASRQGPPAQSEPSEPRSGGMRWWLLAMLATTILAALAIAVYQGWEVLTGPPGGAEPPARESTP